MIDYKQFELRCSQTKEEILALGKVTTVDGHNYTFIDRGADVLAVAHMDYVYTASFHFYRIFVGGNEWVLCPRLDDRIGVYTIVDLLPELGLDVDVLITDEEETGNSTAKYFTTEKQYNYMFQFDRRNGDVVHYQYDTPFLLKRLKRAGFTDISHGSLSDICKLEHLGCSGFNVGTGYKDEHSLWAMANMDTYRSQILKYAEFHKKFSTLHFKHEKKVTKPNPYYRSPSYYNNWGDEDIVSLIPPEGSRTPLPGYVWNHTYKCYMPTATTKPLKTCVKCNKYLWDTNRAKRYSNVCKDCESFYSYCMGCDRGIPVNEKKGKLCDDCEEMRKEQGDALFITYEKCIACTQPLTFYEVEHGKICSECEADSLRYLPMGMM